MGARTEQEQSFGSCVAAVDLSSYNHRLVKVSAANTVNLAGAGETVAGVLMNAPEAGDPAKVSTGVVLPVVAGAAVAAGAALASDASGRAVTASEGNYIFGVALEAAGAAGREFAALMLSQQASLTFDSSAVDVDVAATMEITAGEMVCLDGDGFLVAADEATAVSFWGIALETVDNSLGADGDLTCLVRRFGTYPLTGAGLTETDIGKEVWASDATTVTTTPGDILVGIIDSIASATEPTVRIKPMPIVGQRTERQFTIPFTYIGAVGAVGVVANEDMEFPRKYLPLRAFADAETAPGGAYFCTIELDDGSTQYALTITGSATHGENKTAAALSAAMLAATDTDITLVDDNASGATEGVKGHFLCEAL
jgi:hypothetical protein